MVPWKGKTTTLDEKSSDQSDDGLSRARPNFRDTRKISLLSVLYSYCDRTSEAA
jgi:hypothetical protein